MKLPDVSSDRGAPMGRGWNFDADMARTVVEMYDHTPPRSDVERRHYQVAKTYLAKPSEPVKVTITRIGIDRGGYDSGGAYWGTGQPLYYAASDCGTVDRYIRADSTRAVRVEIRKEFPAAEFGLPRVAAECG